MARRKRWVGASDAVFTSLECTVELCFEVLHGGFSYTAMTQVGYAPRKPSGPAGPWRGWRAYPGLSALYQAQLESGACAAVHRTPESM